MKKIKWLGLIVIILLIIAIILFQVLKVQDKIYKYFYPLKYEEYVYKYAEKYDVDPLFVMAIIKTESNFNEKVVSKSGAKGLMQLMETTAEELADYIGMEYIAGETLFIPEKNIELGVCYYSILLKEYNGDKGLALAAYNAGIGNVSGWIENEVIQNDGSDIENIPFNETNNYVRKTLKNYDIYKKIYQ